jgi:hypothetical protein
VKQDVETRDLCTYPAPPVMMQFLPSSRPMLNDRDLGSCKELLVRPASVLVPWEAGSKFLKQR